MASRYFVNGGVDNNWGTSGNWSASSGGAGGETVPTISDDVFFDGSSPNCSVATSARTCRNFDSTGYTNTITLTTELSINPVSTQTVIFGAGMTWAGSAKLTLNGPTSASVSITTNGVNVPNPVDWGTNGTTWTLNDNFNVSGLLRFITSNGTRNGNTINAAGGFTMVAGSSAGTTVLKATNTGTWSRSGGQLQNPWTIDAGAGTITMGSTFSFQGVLTYVSGTVVTTGNTLELGSTATLNCASVTWNNITWSPLSSILTLSANVTCSGAFAVVVSGTCTITGAFSITVGGNLTISGSGRITTTTAATIVLNGTGTWSQGAATALGVPLTINTAGTITLSGTLWYEQGPLTYTAGTVAGGASVTLKVGGYVEATTTLNLNGLVLNANLTVQRTLSPALNCLLSSGLEIVTGRTVTIIGNDPARLVVFKSDSAGVQRVFTLQAGVLMNIRLHTVTDIDSSGGQTVIWRKPGSISNTINWGETAGGSNGKGGGKGGGGVTQFSPAGARFWNIGNAGLDIWGNS